MKYKDNPFSLDFGIRPELYIPRTEEERKIIGTFMADKPSTHLYMIIGARGMGKTALMTAVSDKIGSEAEWIHIDLDSENNLMEDLFSQLQDEIKAKLPKVKLTVNLKVLNLDISWEEKSGSLRLELDKLLDILARNHARLLVTIDEAVNSSEMREFASYYQHAIREKYPIFVLMTGLFKNIRALQNNRSLTFLRRAAKIDIKPLSIPKIANEFEKVLKMSSEEAAKTAKLTAGYSYAFQMLGHLIFEAGKNKVDDDILREYRYSLYDASYEKIWEELSENERRVVVVLSQGAVDTPVSQIKKKLGMDNNNFSTYRDTLIKSGVVGNTAYGSLGLMLPLFSDYVKEYHM